MIKYFFKKEITYLHNISVQQKYLKADAGSEYTSLLQCVL